MLEPIGSVEEFYAHALAIEREAAKCSREFQEHFADRGEAVLARLCGNLAHFEQDHYQLLLDRSKALTLPELPPDRYRWLESCPPENADHNLVYRVVSPRQLLEIALKAERIEAVEHGAGVERGVGCVGRSCHDPIVRR